MAWSLLTYMWHEAHMAMPPQVPSTGSSALLQSSIMFIPMSVGASRSCVVPSRSMTVTLIMLMAICLG